MIRKGPLGGRPKEDSERVSRHGIASTPGCSGVVSCVCGWTSNHNAWASDSYIEYDRHLPWWMTLRSHLSMLLFGRVA